jgi:hypothetical protein
MILSIRDPRSTETHREKESRETFGATRGAWAGHPLFADGDPLKGGDE